MWHALVHQSQLCCSKVTKQAEGKLQMKLRIKDKSYGDKGVA